MRLCNIFIHRHHHFRNFELDFTYPEGHPDAGKPLDRICLTGGNGTGKSLLLRLLHNVLRDLFRFKSQHLLILKLMVGGRSFYAVYVRNTAQFFYESIDEVEGWRAEISRDGAVTIEFSSRNKDHFIGFEDEPELFEAIWFDNNSDRQVIYAPSESTKDRSLSVTDTPAAKENEVQDLIQEFPFSHVISLERIREFWSLVVYWIRKRDQEFREYQKSPDNKGKSEALVERQFDRDFPSVITTLAKLWNEALEPTGLRYDTKEVEENARFSNQVKGRFKRSGEEGEGLGFHELSTGLRKYMFRLGFMELLFFRREINHAFVMLDDPEQSLSSEIQSLMMQAYQRIIRNGQWFTGTKSPQVLEAFDEAERFHLKLNEEGHPERV